MKQMKRKALSILLGSLFIPAGVTFACDSGQLSTLREKESAESQKCSSQTTAYDEATAAWKKSETALSRVKKAAQKSLGSSCFKAVLNNSGVKKLCKGKTSALKKTSKAIKGGLSS